MAIHELEKVVIGDFTPFEISREEKKRLGQEAVAKILSPIRNREEISALIAEFEERKTAEALFAHYCDKLECDFMVKIYDEEGGIDLDSQGGNKILKNELVKELLASGKSFSDMFISFDQTTYGYDGIFLEISEYIKKNAILGFRDIGAI